jgi:hypothetical protein
MPISRATVPGTKFGIVPLSAAEFNSLPGGWVGADDAAGPLTVDTSAGTVVDKAVAVQADRMIKITARGSVADGDSNSVDGEFWIERDGTNIGRVHRHGDGVALSFIAGFVLDDGPSAGAHTYALRGSTGVGDLSVASLSILIEDIGPAS